MIRSQTKIICTIGPASESLETIEQLFLSGMSIARLNMSHGNHESHLKNIENIRKIEEKYKFKIFIALDTCGPELRIECVGPLKIKAGECVKILCSNKNKIHFSSNDNQAENIGKHHLIGVEAIGGFVGINIDDLINLDDSKLFLKVIDANPAFIIATALNDHALYNNKRIHFKSLSDNVRFISDKDADDLKFAVTNSLDAIFVSFVESSNNLREIKAHIADKTIQIVSKIESRNAIKNINEILEESDGLMIARGDLMNDVGVAKMFSSQKYISQYSKDMPVIMATEMLQSMVDSKTPLRAEISDIGNAILDGCSAIMLSSETAAGKYPVDCVNIMRTVAIDAEEYINSENITYLTWTGPENRSYMLKKNIYLKKM